MATKFLAFVNGKGGVGKTTSVFHVAGVLSKRGERVLVIDMDKQRNSTQSFVLENKPSYTIYDLMIPYRMSNNVLNEMRKSGVSFEGAVTKTLFKHHGNASPRYYGVDIICGDIRMDDQRELALVKSDEFANCIRGGSCDYDWVIVDMPPSNKEVNRITFAFVDHAVIPLTTDDTDSISGYGDIVKEVDAARSANPTLSVLGVYCSRYSPSSLSDYVRGEVEKFSTFIPVVIPRLAVIPEARALNRPLSYYHKGEALEAFEGLVDEITRRIS